MVFIFRQLLKVFEENYSNREYANCEYVIKLHDHKTLGDKTFDFSNDANHVINQARNYAKDSKDLEVKKGGQTLVTKRDLSKTNNALIKMLEKVNIMNKLDKLHENVCREGMLSVGLGNIDLIKYKFKKLNIKIDNIINGKIYVKDKTDFELRKIWKDILVGKESISKLDKLHESVCRETNTDLSYLASKCNSKDAFIKLALSKGFTQKQIDTYLRKEFISKLDKLHESVCREAVSIVPDNEIKMLFRNHPDWEVEEVYDYCENKKDKLFMKKNGDALLKQIMSLYKK